MPKMTLLEMVQDISSAMSSDEVNSIDDTEESDKISRIIRSTYFHLIETGAPWPHLRRFYQLQASGTTDRPTHMSIEDDIQLVEVINYNKRKSTDTVDKYLEVLYKEPAEFIAMCNARVSSNDNVDSVTDDVSNITLLIRNDIAPTYYTSIDEGETLIFDSYDSAVNNTLVGSKTQVIAYKEPTFTLSNTFVPDLPSKEFSYFLNEAKSACFEIIKQAPSAKVEQRAQTGKRNRSHKMWRTDQPIQFKAYGRHRK